MKKVIFMLMGLVTLSGCSTLNSMGKSLSHKELIDVSSGDRAKIRVLETGGESIEFFPNSTCKNFDDKDRGRPRTERLPSSFSDKMLSKLPRYEAKSLGMPFPPNTNSGLQYFEYYVPANKYFLISTYWNFHQVSCPSSYRLAKFSPDKNYELSFIIEKNGACGYHLKEINEQGERIQFDDQVMVSDKDSFCKTR